MHGFGELMIVECQAGELNEALIKVSRALPVKATTPILEGIKLSSFGNTLTLTASDNNLTIEKNINASVVVEGEIIVPGKYFADFVKTLSESDSITLREKNDKLEIAYNNNENTCSIKLLDVTQYQQIHYVDTQNSFAVKQGEFKNRINKVAFAASTDNNVYNIQSVCISVNDNYIDMLATDSFRCAKTSIEVSSSGIKKDIIVPIKNINEIAKVLEDNDDIITVYFEDNYLLVDLFHTKIISKLLTGKYPDIKRMLNDKADEYISLDKNGLKDALLRVIVLNRSNKEPVANINVLENSITVTSKTEESSFNEAVACSVHGKEKLISLNPKKVVDVINVIEEPCIRIYYSKSNNIIIDTEEENSRYLVMLYNINDRYR